MTESPSPFVFNDSYACASERPIGGPQQRGRQPQVTGFTGGRPRFSFGCRRCAGRCVSNGHLGQRQYGRRDPSHCRDLASRGREAPYRERARSDGRRRGVDRSREDPISFSSTYPSTGDLRKGRTPQWRQFRRGPTSIGVAQPRTKAYLCAGGLPI